MQPYVSHLVVPLGQGGQVGLVVPLSRRWGIQVGHELQVYQVYRAHLGRDG